jgi:dolichyl-phosphate-mannose--protein O-mannosyl transferase
MSHPSSDAPMVWKRWHVLLFLGLVLALSYLTYFHRYWNPPNVFWDENYHIASAQKYLHNVYFMEQHPPLGKLLVALGEKIFHPNLQTDQFLGTDYGNNFDGFSFVGYRFFSALLSWWTAPLLFLIFLTLLRNPLHSALLSFLYIFDNAMIVHMRGAMLEGPLIFFCALTILFFLLFLFSWLFFIFISK